MQATGLTSKAERNSVVAHVAIAPTYLCWIAMRRGITVSQLPSIVPPFKAQTPRVKLGFNGHDRHVRSPDVDASRRAFLLLLKEIKGAWSAPSAPHKSVAQGRECMSEVRGCGEVRFGR